MPTNAPTLPGQIQLKKAPKEALVPEMEAGGDGFLSLPVVEAPPSNARGKRPDWLRVRLPYGETYKSVLDTIEKYDLHTVCQSARCPNMGECWSAGTATFMILGNVCTRSCGFCAVMTGRPDTGLDWDEPRRVAEAAKLMDLRHVVVTSVNRDERKDGGAPDLRRNDPARPRGAARLHDRSARARLSRHHGRRAQPRT